MGPEDFCKSGASILRFDGSLLADPGILKAAYPLVRVGYVWIGRPSTELGFCRR